MFLTGDLASIGGGDGLPPPDDLSSIRVLWFCSSFLFFSFIFFSPFNLSFSNCCFATCLDSLNLNDIPLFLLTGVFLRLVYFFLSPLKSFSSLFSFFFSLLGSPQPTVSEVRRDLLHLLE